MTCALDDDIARCLIDEAALRRRVDELAAEVTAACRETPLTAIIVSNGAIIFGADLVRRIPLSLELDSVSLSSYIGSESSGSITWHSQLRLDVADRAILVIEDILDSGRTLARLTAELYARGAASVRTCVLLAKQGTRRMPVDADFVGFTIPDEFVVGYGLDYNERYRNLPYIGVLKARVYDREGTRQTA